MSRPRIAVLDDYQRLAADVADWDSLDAGDVVFFHDWIGTEDQIGARLADFDILVTMRERTPFPATTLDRLGRLKYIVTPGPYNAAIDVEHARSRGVVVSGLRSANWLGITATVQLAWGLVLALVHDIPRHDASVRAGGWQVSAGTVLAGRRLGLVGLGNVGRRMVPVAKAFGMQVVAWSENLTQSQAHDASVERLARDEFFASCDVVSVHVKLSARSRGYVRRDDLARMKSTAYFINTSRGPIVDEEALIEALTSGWIAGAGLDVFSLEPLPADHPMRTLPRTVVTPHVGYVTTERLAEYYQDAVRAIRFFLAGAPVSVLAE